MPIDLNLTDKLRELDQIYGGENMYKMLGPTVLSWTSTDSSRMYMFTSHLKQAFTLLEPDIPRLQTGFENSVGKYNRSYKKLKGDWEIIDIIYKTPFQDKLDDPIIRKNSLAVVVLYSKALDKYDMIEKPLAEDLTEKFGFIYNTEFIDSAEIGKTYTDPVLFKSTAYDDNMNYRYGKNANVYYSTSTDTIEDAIVIRRGWAESVKSVEIDTIQVSINANDVLINLYGDDDNYQAFPELGNSVSESLICATRRINNNHLLHDFQKDALRHLSENDTDYYTSKDASIYDINVYYNGDQPFPDNVFHKQMKVYYDANAFYAQRILDRCNLIKESNSKYTENVSYFRARYMNYNNPIYKWKNKDKTFGHIVLEFKVKAITSLEPGAKMSGRYGNKGVISSIETDNTNINDSLVDLMDDGTMTKEERDKLKQQITIVDDSRMPYYIKGDGTRVYADVLCNASGSVRRLNPEQLCEVETNFIGEQVREKVINAATLPEKEALIFKFLEAINSKQADFFRGIYAVDTTIDNVNGSGSSVDIISDEAKMKFIKNVEEYGFYIVRPPHLPLLYDDVINLYKIFPDIAPVDIYVDLYGRQSRKNIRRGIIGYQYMLILKQNSNKNFSARSTYRVNRSNLPTKDIAKKTNRSSYGRTPVRLSEIYNILASISARDLAEYNVFMRSSAIGRKSLDMLLAINGSPLKIKSLPIKHNYTNANADILACRLKAIGLRARFSKVQEDLHTVYMKDEIVPLTFGKYTIYDYPHMRKIYTELFNRFDKEIRKGIYIETYQDEKYDTCWDAVISDEEFMKKYDIGSDTIDTVRLATKSKSSEIRTAINSYNTQSKVEVADPGEIRRRGRKSNAEKERLRNLELKKIQEGEEMLKKRISE